MFARVGIDVNRGQGWEPWCQKYSTGQVETAAGKAILLKRATGYRFRLVWVVLDGLSDGERRPLTIDEVMEGLTA